jgi:hypothetical protein
MLIAFPAASTPPPSHHTARVVIDGRSIAAGLPTAPSSW